MGVAVLAGTIVSLMLFNGLFHNKKHVEIALLEVVTTSYTSHFVSVYNNTTVKYAENYKTGQDITW